MNLSCANYSDKAIVVRGDTKDCKDDLKNLGGKYNANLRDGPGWIFSKKNEGKVTSFIASKNVKTEIKHVSGSLLSTIEHALKKMNFKERLVFLANVTKIASMGDLPVASTEDIPTVKVTISKKILSDDDPVNKFTDSDMDNSSEDETCPKRLLKPNTFEF